MMTTPIILFSNLALIGLFWRCLVPSRSRSLIWGIFQLIIEESGGEGRDGKGRFFLPTTHRSRSALASSPPARAPRSHVIPPLASKSALAWPWKSLWRRQLLACGLLV